MTKRDASGDGTRRTQFLITNPYDQDGLVSEVPPGAELEGIENLYQYEKWPHEKAYCVHCKAHRHREGFTAKLTGGGLAMIGSDCGEKLFGAKWTVHEQQFRDAMKREDLIRALDDFTRRLPGAAALAMQWTTPIQVLSNARDGFRKVSADLASALFQAVEKDGGRLMAERKYRDLAAEARQPSRDDDDKDPPMPIYNYERVPMWQLRGFRAFERQDPVQRLRHAQTLIQKALTVAESRETASNSRMSQAVRQIDDAREIVQAVYDMARGLPDFFGMENLKQLAAWANAEGRFGSFSVSDDGRFLNSQTGVGVGPLRHFPTPDSELVKLLRRDAA